MHAPYIPQKFGGPSGMCWQQQELTQVAQGREQVGLFAAKSLSPFLVIHAGSSVHLCRAPLWNMLASPIPSLFTFIHQKGLEGTLEQSSALYRSK